MTITARRIAASYYEIDTPAGTHTIARLVVTRGMDGWEHRRCGTYWMHTPPGEFEPSGEFPTLREAVTYVREHFGTETTRPIVAKVSFAPADLERLKAKDEADRAAWRTSMDERKAAERKRFGPPSGPEHTAR